MVRKWHGVTEVFQTPVELKVKLCEFFPDDTSTGNNMKMDYFQGHQKCWIFDHQDLHVMYRSFKPDSLITLWCDRICDAIPSEPSSKRRKRATSPVSIPSTETEDDLDVIFKQLKTKHSTMENAKLRLWARLIEKGRYDDYDTPPQIPLITGSPAPAKKKHDSVSEALVTVVAKALQTSNRPASPSGQPSGKDNSEPPSKLSPFKHAQLRRSCLEDLKSLKDLYEDDVLCEAEFLEEKSRILNTLKTLS